MTDGGSGLPRIAAALLILRGYSASGMAEGFMDKAVSEPILAANAYMASGSSSSSISFRARSAASRMMSCSSSRA
jgi:hypothetical protein